MGTLLLPGARFAYAQDGSGTLFLSAEDANGARAVEAAVDVTSSDGSVTRSVVLTESSPVHALSLPAGAYRVRAQKAGFRTAELSFYNAPGGRVELIARLSPDRGAVDSQIVVQDRSGIAHQTVFTSGHLNVLPGTGTVWSLLETSHPFLISDRIDNGGLWSAEPSLLSGYGSSWSQTTFQLGGLDVTDPHMRGLPLFHADLGVLEAVQVDSARMPAEMGGPGPVIVMVPRMPGPSWTGTAQAFVTPESWQGSETGAAAPIARFDSWTDASVVAGGPLGGNKLGLLASARVTRVRRVERSAELLEGDVRSVFVHARSKSARGGELRLVSSFSDITRPFGGRARFEDRDLEERVNELVLHPVWERAGGAHAWSIGGGYQRFSLDPRVPSSAAGGTIERLKDGPPLALAGTAQSVRERWDVRTALTPALKQLKGQSHLFRIGVAAGGASVSNVPIAAPAFRELVNGRAARVWDVSYVGSRSRWAAFNAGAFASDRIAITSGLTVDAGLRFDYDSGSADGASSSIGWAALSPRLSARWRPRDASVSITSAYSWYSHRLPLSYFEVGDPAGPSGSMYRWDDLNGDRQYVPGELTRVAAIGACCAGNTIDEGLRQPSTREFVIGLEHVLGSWRWSVTGIDRREHDLVGLVNAGVTQSDYSVTYIQDPGIDLAGLSGLNSLPVYNRSISSFGRDRYTLTNPNIKPSRYQAVEIVVERPLGSRWDLRFGGSAHRGEGAGANRGFRADENDQGLLGELFLNPNAETSAYGRVFFDRGYAIKISGGYRAPRDVRVGLAARYQDGQPFSRLVIAESLNQGPEAIQAYPRGGQRFTYTLTLDARVEKDLRLGPRTLGLVLEAFNLLDNTKEVEEDIVTGPSFRTVTAVQPPRAIRVGARFAF